MLGTFRPIAETRARHVARGAGDSNADLVALTYDLPGEIGHRPPIAPL
jgi:hypothetical protein